VSTKQKILETALKLFNESNTQTATTNHIAKAMNISSGNLHYHYKNREEIIQKIYIQLRNEMSLSIETLPKTVKELSQHEKTLIEIQWKYRFFFRELLFLFSRDEALQKMYIADNIAHRCIIYIVMYNLIEHNELEIDNDDDLEFLIDSILMSWQFYTSYMYTLGRCLDAKGIEEVVAHTHNAMRPFMTKKDKK
jgi:AcrR family transcriptional regulator